MEDKTKKYEKLKMIGTGMFGKAWLVRSRPSGRSYVIKEIEVSGMTSHEMAQTVNEVAILSRLKHKNVIRYREAFTSTSALHIVMEFADQGDLAQQIEDQRQKVGFGFPEEQVLDWTVQICFALSYIHDIKILHRDLKPANIFLTSSKILKVGDFGIAKILKNTVDHAQTAIGTPYYLSPEICQRKPYNQKSDIWALGCVLYELVTLQHPFQAKDFSNLVVNILSGIYPSVPSDYSLLMSDLISVLLRVSPERRPIALEVLKVPKLRRHVTNYTNRKHESVTSLPTSSEETPSANNERAKRTRLGGISSMSEVKAAESRRRLQSGKVDSCVQRSYVVTSSVSKANDDSDSELNTPLTGKNDDKRHRKKGAGVEKITCRLRNKATPSSRDANVERRSSVKGTSQESSNGRAPSLVGNCNADQYTGQRSTVKRSRKTRCGGSREKRKRLNGCDVADRTIIPRERDLGGKIECKKTYLLQKKDDLSHANMETENGVLNRLIDTYQTAGGTNTLSKRTKQNKYVQLSTNTENSTVFKVNICNDESPSRKNISSNLPKRSASENGIAASRSQTVVSSTPCSPVSLNKTIEIAEVMHAGTPTKDEDTGSVRGRLESLRDYLEDKLGTVKCVDALECLGKTTESERLVKLMNDRIGSNNMRYFPVLLQVWNLENRCH